VVAFGGVVVDHVEDDLHAGRVQRTDHGLELVHLARGAVARFRSEEADGVVAPVVAQSPLDQIAVVDEGVHRQQLHRGDAQTLEIVDHRRGGEPRVSSAQWLGHVRIEHRVAAHVQLVDHHVVPRHIGGAVVVPGEGRLGHLAFGHAAGTVAPVEREVVAPVADGVAEHRVAPAQASDDVAGIRIEQQLGRIEAMAFFGLVGTVHAITVQPSRPSLGQVAMPDVIGVFAHLDALGFAPPIGAEQAQLHLLGMLGEEREVDPFAVPCGAQGVRAARPDRADRAHEVKRGWRCSSGASGTTTIPDSVMT
jgi:hypothetical protein